MEYPFELINRKSKLGKRNITLIDKSKEWTDKSTGEIHDFEYSVVQSLFLDGTEFVKIYDILPIVRLDSCAIRVFLFVASILKFGGEFTFKYAECMAITGLSKTMVYRGIKILEQNDIVKKTGGHQYFINWNIAYRGNRDKKDEKENR